MFDWKNDVNKIKLWLICQNGPIGAQHNAFGPIIAIQSLRLKVLFALWTNAIFQINPQIWLSSFFYQKELKK